jgi:hypothetical protein
MATQYAFGKIVTDGLVLALDAADKNSYPGSGTTWRDLSGNNRTHTVPAGYSYNSTINKGAFVNNDSVYTNFIYDNNIFNLINIPEYSTFTLSIAFNFTTDEDSYAQFLIGQSNIGNEQTLLSIAIFYPDILSITGESLNNDNWTTVSNINPDTNYILTIVSNSSLNNILCYLNGIYINSLPAFTNLQAFGIGGSQDDVRLNTFNSLHQGKIYNCHLYNRALSSQEILQNYNAQKSRFNL